MFTNLQNWCRLCANYDCTLIDILVKHNSIDDVLNTLQKYFKIIITENDKKPQKICNNCFEFLLKWHHFYDQCTNAENLYNELLQNNLKLNLHEKCEVDKIRLKFKLYNKQEATRVSVKNDQITDSCDLNIVEEENKLCEGDLKRVIIPKKRLKKRIKGNLEYPSNQNEQKKHLNLQFNDEDDKKLSDIRNEINLSNHAIDFIDFVNNSDDSDDHYDDKVFNTIIEPIANLTEINAQIEATKDSKECDYNGIFKCEICDKIFSKRSTYKCHLKSKHGTNKLFCSKCPKFFTTKDLLRCHEKVHLPNSMKMIHSCPCCDKKFSKAANVKTHMKTIHSNERSFVCDECGKGFKTKGALQGHQLSHTEERPFQCPDCPKKFKSLAKLKIHSDVHSGNTYLCSVCKTEFKTKKSLQNHMIVHSDIKKYKCRYCGNKYKRTKDLKYHLISHMGLRPHECPYCDKTFVNPSNCRTHQKRVHPSEFANAEANGEPQRVTNIPKLEHLQLQYSISNESEVKTV